jgi:hypothetical protein
MDNVWLRDYLIEGEIVDTHGGDYTHRDVWAIDAPDGLEFYQQYSGAKPSDVEQIFDPSELSYLTEIWKLRYGK